jgi:tetratricopeptide (TPR) repeat protein
LFDKTFELNGNDVFDNNLMAYMDVIRRFKLTGGKITDEEIIEKYTQITDIIAVKSANGDKSARYTAILDNVDKILTATVTVDCNFVETTLGPKLKETGDVKMAKKIVQLMLTGKCTDSPLFIEAAKKVNEVEPNFGMAKVIAIKAGAEGDFANAEKYYNQAVELTDENEKKGEIYQNMAQLYAANGQKSAARASARKSLSVDPSNGSAYSLIGDLYMRSFNECKGGTSKVDDRAIFIAAYNMYSRGGDSAGMNNAKSQFPSAEELFNENKKEGDSMTVGCWINESVTLQKRP